MLTEKNATEVFASRFNGVLQDILAFSEDLDATKLKALLSGEEYALLLKLTTALHKPKRKKIENSSGLSV